MICTYYDIYYTYDIHMLYIYIRCISRVVGWDKDWMQGRAVRAYSYVRCLVY